MNKSRIWSSMSICMLICGLSHGEALSNCESANECFELGEKHYWGRDGLERDVEVSMPYFQLACEKQHAIACLRMMSFYVRGLVVKENQEIGAKYCAQSCELGEMTGCAFLGSAYAEGVGVEINLTKAEQLYRKACLGGSGIGCGNLANLISENIRFKSECDDIEKLREQAVKLLLEECSDSDPEICHRIANKYEKGVNGFKKDAENAKLFHEKACYSGDSLACEHLAPEVTKPEVLSTEPNKAAKAFVGACRGGNAVACQWLWKIYDLAKKVETAKCKDEARIDQCLKKTADGNEIPNDAKLAEMTGEKCVFLMNSKHTSAEFLALIKGNEYVKIDREHMYSKVTERGQWTQDLESKVIFLVPEGDEKIEQLEQFSPVEYKGLILVEFPDLFRKIRYHQITRMSFAQEASTTQPFRYRTELNDREKTILEEALHIAKTCME